MVAASRSGFKAFAAVVCRPGQVVRLRDAATYRSKHPPAELTSGHSTDVYTIAKAVRAVRKARRV